MRLHHFGNGGQLLAKFFQRVVAVAVECHHEQHRIAQPQRLGVQTHGVALDHTLVFHALDARPAG